jgi:endonuclease/exonuclease/phosphatase family metal-dependent hydrolase
MSRKAGVRRWSKSKSGAIERAAARWIGRTVCLVILTWLTSEAAQIPVVQARVARARSASPTIETDSPWYSLQACEAVLRRGQRLSRASGKARIGTWNIRWFPRGTSGNARATQPTNIEWLACAITWTQVDVLLVQEILRDDEGRKAMSRLLRRLEQLSAGRWRGYFDTCPGGGFQHVGIIANVARVQLNAPRMIGQINPLGQACASNLRPGFGVYARFPGGLSVHLMSVHLKSGPKVNALDLRLRSWRGLDGWQHRAPAGPPDEDVIVGGDFNTMGCGSCGVSAADERVALEKAAASFRTPLRLVASSPPCTEYYRGRGGLLDHFLVAKTMRELPPIQHARVVGYCEALSCRPTAREQVPRAYVELSDHCPLVLDLDDRDYE